MARLSPRPDERDLGRYYPDAYWFDPGENAASRLAEKYRRLVVGDHLRFVMRAWRDAGARGRLLDVGCGGGLIGGLLRAKGVQAIGFDLSRQACSVAWSRHRLPAACGSLVSNPFRLGSFSVVSLFHVLEHLSDPGACLAAAGDLLASTGRLIVQVPNFGSWQARIFRAAWNGIDIPRHLNHFRPTDLNALLQQSGFEVARTKHFSWRDNPAGFATSLASGLDPMARRIRGLRSGWLHYGGYLALVGASVPFALLEAAFAHGSTIMIEARKA